MLIFSKCHIGQFTMPPTTQIVNLNPGRPVTEIFRGVIIFCINTCEYHMDQPLACDVPALVVGTCSNFIAD